MSIRTHRLWPEVLGYLVAEEVPYDKRMGDGKPRVRLEFRGVPPAKVREFTRVIAPCVACGQPINPVRDRGRGHLYLAVAHSNSEGPGCSRGKAASEEYRRIEEDLRQHAKPEAKLQDALF